MPSQKKTGCGKKSRFGWIAVGYSKSNDFWYSSEGVFREKKEAIGDLCDNYPVDQWIAHRIPLRRSKTPSQG